MKKINHKSITLALPLILLMPVANADWGIGVGVDNQNKIYKNSKDDARLLLGLEYRGEKFNMDKDSISYDFTNSKKYAIEAIIKSNNASTDSYDTPILKGMDKRKTSIDIGARGIYKTGFGPVVVEMTKDVYASKGFEADVRLGGIEPHAEHWTGKHELHISPLIGVKYQSDKVVDYHYGVKSSEATATRAAYKGKAATTPYIGVQSQLNINKHFSLNAGVIYEHRDDSIKNSPLTNNKDSDLHLNLGMTYWF